MDYNNNQQQGGGDNAFVPGLRMFRPDNAPQFVLGKLTITVQELFNFIQNNPQALSVYNGQQQLQVDLLWSKAGKPYCKLNTYNAGGNQGAQRAPQAPAGYPPAQAAPQGYPQSYPQQPQAPASYPPVQQPYGPYPQQPQQQPQAPQQGYPTGAPAPTYPQPQQPQAPAGYPPAGATGVRDDLPF